MTQSNDPIAVVLAAGQGTRMKSDLPKVLCPVLGRPMIDFVLDALQVGGVQKMVVVVGYRGEDVRRHLESRLNLTFVEQTERLGTGHAVKMALPQLEHHAGPVMIVAGDSPMLQPSSVRGVLEAFSKLEQEGRQPACILGTLHKENPTGLGRIVRDGGGNFLGIVEEKDATESQRQITEVNMSTYVFAAAMLVSALQQLRNDNRQKEFYLTDCPSILLGEGKLVEARPILQACEALSINTPEELGAVEAKMREMGYKGGGR